MDGQEKALLKDAVRSLRPTEDVQAASVNSKAVVKRAAKLAEERGIVESSKKARKHLEQFPKAERYIQKQVRKLLGEDCLTRSEQNEKIGNSKKLTAAEQTPTGNCTQQVDGHSHVLKCESAWEDSQQENQLPLSKAPLTAKATKKRKRDVVKQTIAAKAQAEENAEVKEAPEPKKKSHKKKAEKLTFGRDSWKEDSCRTDVKAGQFSTAEDEALLAAVCKYAEQHDLPQDDLSWVSKLPTMKKATYQRYKTQALSEIAAVLPHRKLVAIRSRLQRLTHHGNNKGQWTEAEKQKVLELHEMLGNAWVKISEHVDRLPAACRDLIRDLTTSAEVHTGPWTMEETQLLEVACHKQMQLNKEGTNGKGIYRVGNTRDGIDWEVVSRQVGTRSPRQCGVKWYTSVRPGMIATGEWGEGQDTELLKELLARKPMSEAEIAWGNLIEGRSRLIVRERWGMMRSKIPCSRRFELNQQVMYLIARFRPKLLKNADTSGPYGVSAEDAAAAIAKVSRTIQEQSEIADRIAAAAQ